jgi:hypothetical protein
LPLPHLHRLRLRLRLHLGPLLRPGLPPLRLPLLPLPPALPQQLTKVLAR